MPLFCPRCYSRDFYLTGYSHDTYQCRECGYTGQFFLDLDDDSVVAKLRNHNGLPPIRYDTTDFSRWGVIGLAVLVALFLGVMYLVLGPHP